MIEPTAEERLAVSSEPERGYSQFMTFGSRAGTFTTVVGWDLPNHILYEDLDIVLAA